MFFSADLFHRQPPIWKILISPAENLLTTNILITARLTTAHLFTSLLTKSSSHKSHDHNLPDHNSPAKSVHSSPDQVIADHDH
ncbi:unnamed protein product [Brassica napus]|uniref:(rape) hypothetical protein n=1 Tax=Brassica napus TaxID=3708 RepID=A0A816SQ12_BRANA|nr:unnamed protein product [Brassica napus]